MKQNSMLWALAALMSVIFTVVLLAFVFFETPRHINAKPAISGKFLSITDKSKAQLTTFLRKEEIVVGVAAIDVDLIQNNRKTVFFLADEPSLQEAWNEYTARRAKAVVVFNGEGRSKFNDRVTKLINGVFDCRPFSTTIGYTFYPAANETAPWLCSLSTPPGFDGSGDFIGFINLHMSREPTEDEKSRLSTELTKISLDIYKRDAKDREQK